MISIASSGALLQLEEKQMPLQKNVHEMACTLGIKREMGELVGCLHGF